MSRFGMARATLEHLVEDAELRVQRGQIRLDRQRKAVAALERADQIHLADRDRLTKRLARPPR